MRAPALLLQCLPGLTPTERGHQSTSGVSEGGSSTPLPAVEVLPSKATHPFKYSGENVDQQGLGMLKGRLSVADVIGFGSSDIICSKPDGFLKSWDSSIDLVNVLKHEIRDGQLTFRGKRVLELGCHYGLPGIFACMKGASIVHFQDLSAEIIRCTTIPNVLIALEQVRDWQSRQPESPLTPSRQSQIPSVHFYAGDWDELHGVLSIVRVENFEVNMGINFCFSEEESVDGCSSLEGSIVGQDFSLRRSRKLSGSRAWERASEADKGDGGYDVVLMAELPYSLASLKKLYALLKKCLRPPYGVAYLASKRNYVGFNSGARHLRNLVDEEGIFGIHLVKEMADRDIWKFFLK
ncbi:hypothetical protein MLD38_023857 [Melastoma candidum]|uniref:Uncharacterized protein n=1 Tax=Melastoma candidum TaxID=119954 RepID=A0ACB9NQL4_9MYRT|nr:hypothetical protein MLD38_023857 [Melastoma candidum]